MKKFIFSAFSALIIYLSIGVLLARYDVGLFPIELSQVNNSPYQDYAGALHLDLSGTTAPKEIDKIIRQAQEANLDFLFVDQFNSFETPPKDQIHDNLLLFFTQKVSYLRSHLLVLNKTPEPPFEDMNQAQIFLTDEFTSSTSNSDLAISLLHPKKSGYEWTPSKYPMLFEVLNLKSMWHHSYLKSRLSFLWTLLVYPFNTELAIVRLFENAASDEIDLYDEIIKKSPAYGFCGIHAKPKLSLGPLQFPSYKTLFSACKNHILLKGELTGNTESDRAKIFEALKKGQFYYSVDLLGNPRGFFTEASNNTATFPMGSQLKLDDSTKISIHLPKEPSAPMEVVIYKDHQRVFTSNSLKSTFHIHEPGTYRVVVRVIPTFPLPDGKKWITWIYSNPFFIQ